MGKDSAKKVWCRLFGKDLLIFKNNDTSYFESMHNLAGTFITEESPLIIKGMIYYCIGIIFNNKMRKYYTNSLTNYRVWLSILQKNTHNENILSNYEIGVKIYLI
jgi:hypothetical protein